MKIELYADQLPNMIALVQRYESMISSIVILRWSTVCN